MHITRQDAITSHPHYTSMRYVNWMPVTPSWRHPSSPGKIHTGYEKEVSGQQQAPGGCHLRETLPAHNIGHIKVICEHAVILKITDADILKAMCTEPVIQLSEILPLSFQGRHTHI